MRGIISPKLHEFIEQANLALAEAKRNNVQLTPSLVRENIEKLGVYIGDGPELAYVQEDEFVTSTHSIAVRVYSPAPDEELPVVVHYHGGGHACGNIALYDTISRKIAKVGHCVVIAVEYRLAPEFPYPMGLDDCQYALEHYKEVLTQVKYNQQLIIIGDSAGGAICTSLVGNNINNELVKIDKQILIYPSVDYTMSYPSFEENGTGFLLEKIRVKWYFDSYLQGKEFESNQARKAVSALFMPMNNTMPETLIFSAGCDPLRDEALAYEEALKSVDIKVEHHIFDGMIHAYMLLDSLVAEECEETYQRIGEFIGK